MLGLRPFKYSDATIIASWCKDEGTFRRWSAGRFGDFPISEEDILSKYVLHNGDCAETDNFYPMTAYDESGVVGHLVLRYVNGNRYEIRFGFVIVDDAKRGCGYGKEMIQLALKYAFEILRAEKVTIGVFENNVPAYHCYKAAGFKDVLLEEPETCNLCGEIWNILELEMTKSDYE